MKNREKRHKRIRSKIVGSEKRPRVSVFRSSKNIQAQLILDTESKTIYGMSTIVFKKDKGTKIEKSKKLGIEFGKLILKDGKYESISFDRGGYMYHGRIKAFADGLRESGIKF